MGCQDESTEPRPREKDRLEESGRPIDNFHGDIFSRGASKEQLEALRVAAEAYKAAQEKVMDAAGVLWNSQVDSAIEIGGEYGASIAMSRRLNFFDNCTCSPCPIVVNCW